MTAIEIVELPGGSDDFRDVTPSWTMRYKGSTPNFFLVNPTSAFDGLVASAVRILSYGEN